jgi:hypothetical protein|tara:strand:- start:1746 stop:2408 length:663 start_codon:yes stop_codon:yes gene_type:complete
MFIESLLNKHIYKVAFRGMTEFGFVENSRWLKPFIIQLKEHYAKISQVDNNIDDDLTTTEQTIFTDSSLTFQDATDFAIHNLDTIFKENCFSMFRNKHSWTECIEKGNQHKRKQCRVSRGFGNRVVPNHKIFNDVFHDKKYEDVILLAKHSYRYLYYRNEIEIILKTPSSDYTRFSIECYINILNKFFMMNLRNIQKNDAKKLSPFEQILETYDSKVQVM